MRICGIGVEDGIIISAGVDDDPYILAGLHGNVLGLDVAVVAVDDHMVDPRGHLSGVVLADPQHGLTGPLSKGVIAAVLPRPAGRSAPAGGNIGVDGNVAGSAGVVGARGDIAASAGTAGCSAVAAGVVATVGVMLIVLVDLTGGSVGDQIGAVHVVIVGGAVDVPGVAVINVEAANLGSAVAPVGHSVVYAVGNRKLSGEIILRHIVDVKLSKAAGIGSTGRCLATDDHDRGVAGNMHGVAFGGGGRVAAAQIVGQTLPLMGYQTAGGVAVVAVAAVVISVIVGLAGGNGTAAVIAGLAGSNRAAAAVTGVVAGIAAAVGVLIILVDLSGGDHGDDLVAAAVEITGGDIEHPCVIAVDVERPRFLEAVAKVADGVGNAVFAFDFNRCQLGVNTGCVLLGVAAGVGHTCGGRIVRNDYHKIAVIMRGVLAATNVCIFEVLVEIVDQAVPLVLDLVAFIVVTIAAAVTGAAGKAAQNQADGHDQS